MFAGFLARLRSLRRGLRRRGALDAEMDEEFEQHIALRAVDLVRERVPPDEANRQARVEFGHVISHREDARASRGLRWLDAMGLSWLDVRLGLRMLRKYPGLSLISIIGMTVAIAIGAGTVAYIETTTDPHVPLDEGDRIVSVQNNARVRGLPDHQTLFDFVEWRSQLTSVRDLSAFTSDRRNLIVPGHAVALVRIAQMTASGFRVARVAPLLGRALLDADEQPGATPVVVIGYDEWQKRFDGDSGVVGRTVRLGTTETTVVGVMPPGFRFPFSDQYWVPLPLDAARHYQGSGPVIYVFGRLADGVTLTEAQTELSTIGQRLAAAWPETHRDVKPEVLPYTWPFLGIDSPGWTWLMHAAELAISLLLVVIAVNVAILVYARTAARAGEIAVRTALGASRRRIVTQLFAESLVSSAVAAVLGLTLSAIALHQLVAFWQRSDADAIPFWMHFGISPGIVAYTVGLAILAAVIVGVLPALKATGRRVQSGLKQLSTHGSGMQLGRTWTILIIAQVAVAVAALPFAVYISGISLQRATAKPSYPAAQVLQTRLFMERQEAPPAAEAETYQRAMSARFHGNVAKLVRRLQAEPAVAAVSLSSAFPDGGSNERIEVEGVAGNTTAQRGAARWARTVDVDTALFQALDLRLLAGRPFEPRDVREDAGTVIVDRVFADAIGGGNVLGRRIRVMHRTSDYDCGTQPYPAYACMPVPGTSRLEAGPWLQIVGVTPAFAVQADFDPIDSHIFRPLVLAKVSGGMLALSIRIRNGPALAFSPRLRSIAASVDPALQLDQLKTYAAARRRLQEALLGVALVIVAVTASVLLLSAAGIYAMMSFTIVRRRREIGIRLALGADPRHLLTGIFARASVQLGAGAFVGLLLAAAITGPMDTHVLMLLPLVAVIMIIVGLLAALGPARRGLAVQPTETLREE